MTVHQSTAEDESRLDRIASVEDYLGENISPQAFLTPLPDDIAAETVERLKQEADRYWGIDPRRSLELAGRIVAIGQARSDQRQAALGVMARGDALKLLGRSQEAWETLEQAGEMFALAGDEVGWARTRIGRLALSVMLERVDSALADARQAREIFIRQNEPEKLLRLEFQEAYIYNDLGDPQAAVERFLAALATAEELGDTGQAYLGTLYNNLGSAYEALGDLHQAETYYQRAYDRFSARGETLHLATAETNLGFIAQAQGNYRRALRLLNRALERVSGHFDLEATHIKCHLLECYQGLNRSTEALDLARQAAADYRQLKDSFELGRVLLQLGAFEAEAGRSMAAKAALDEAEGIFSTMGAVPMQAIVWLRRGRIALRQGNPTEALRQALQARQRFEAAGQAVNAAQTDLLEGQARLAAGELPAAQAAGRIALRAAQRFNVPALRYSAHLLMGQAHEAEAADRRALRAYGAAAAVIERVQRGLTITLRPGFLEDKAEAWRALIGLHLRLGQAEAAFSTLERAKSQALLGYLANRERLRWAQDEPESRALIATLDRLRAEHQWYYHLAQASTQATAPAPGAENTSVVSPEQALAELASRERQMRAITERLYLLGAESGTPDPAPLPDLAELWQSLDDNTRLVEYYNDGNALWAFTLDSSGIRAHSLPLTPQDLDGLLDQLQVNFAAALKMGPQAPAAPSLGRLARRILQRLHAGLVTPLEASEQAPDRWVIVPYGALHFLPFHLLFDGSAYLIEKREVVLLPAAGLAARRGPQRRGGARVLAHSWNGRLPHTHAEAEMVWRLFGGELHLETEAGRPVFQAAPAQVLHIAAHGQFRLDQPDLSYIQLADGQLYADDLLQQDLSYELVTLSACETGRARVAGGEELIGLGRGFLYAGAGALVLSLWPVADDIALHIMERFYTTLQQGASKAAALRQAQRLTLAETSELHPAFWGAFQLVGEAGPLTRPA
jgi:CHAT domain-containing protein